MCSEVLLQFPWYFSQTCCLFRIEWAPSVSCSLSWGRCCVTSAPVTALFWLGEFQGRVQITSDIYCVFSLIICIDFSVTLNYTCSLILWFITVWLIKTQDFLCSCLNQHKSDSQPKTDCISKATYRMMLWCINSCDQQSMDTIRLQKTCCSLSNKLPVDQ